MFKLMNKIKIFPKLLLSILVVVAIPLASLWYVNSEKYEVELEKNLHEKLSKTGDVLSEKITGWTNTNLRLLDYSAELDDVKSMQTYRQAPIMKNILENYEWTFLVYAVGADGYKTARSDDVPLVNASGEKTVYRGDRAYFRQVMQGQGYGQQVLISRTLGKPAFILCSPIKPLEIEGALCIGMTLEKMSALVREVELGETGYAVLLDSTNKVIAHGRRDIVTESLKDLSQHPMIKRDSLSFSEYEIDGVKKVGYRVQTGASWNLIVEQDYDEVYAPLRKAQQQTLLFLVVTLAACILVAHWVSMRIANPIKRLTEIADGISKGKFIGTKIAEDKREDEIGSLARAIERMSMSIHIAFKKLREQK